MNSSSLITVAYGDGIGPEIMDATLHVLREAGAQLEIESVQLGQRVYGMGSLTGVLPSAWESLSRTRILLKAPTVQPDIEKTQAAAAAICGHFNLDMQTWAIEECGEFSAMAYISEQFALFEPVQKALPELAGKNKAHPAPMLLAAILLLRHIGQRDIADAVQAALRDALQNHKKKIRTTRFAEAVAERLQPFPSALKPVANC